MHLVHGPGQPALAPGHTGAEVHQVGRHGVQGHLGPGEHQVREKSTYLGYPIGQIVLPVVCVWVAVDFIEGIPPDG